MKSKYQCNRYYPYIFKTNKSGEKKNPKKGGVGKRTSTQAASRLIKDHQAGEEKKR